MGVSNCLLFKPTCLFLLIFNTLNSSEQGSLIRSYQEHEKRCWGVQFCNVDPRLLASASDDSKVKIWSTNSEYSLLSIDAKSNVCCVVLLVFTFTFFNIRKSQIYSKKINLSFFLILS